MNGVGPIARQVRSVSGLRRSASGGHSSRDAGQPGTHLRAQERVRFKTAVLMYKATHGTAPSYLSQLVRVADLPGPLYSDQSFAGAVRETVYHQRPGLPGRQTHHLEQPAISVNLPSAFKNISVPGLIP